MVKETMGDLLTSGADIICHQANYFGVMGAGVAYAIRTKLLSRDQYKEYEQYCQSLGSAALGTVQFIQLGDGKYLANVFSQDDLNPQFTGASTDYEAVERGLKKVDDFAKDCGLKNVALPGYMGCGIAGGDWKRVLAIIRRVFRHSTTNCVIVYKD